jgi:hypothetical protein
MPATYSRVMTIADTNARTARNGGRGPDNATPALVDQLILSGNWCRPRVLVNNRGDLPSVAGSILSRITTILRQYP